MADDLLSNDTYARLWPSGDQAGDMSGSLEVAMSCRFSPSASATYNLYVCWGGVPSALTYAMRVYQNAFLYLRMGYASAMAWILFLLTLGLTLLAVRAARSRVHYTT